MNDPTNKIHQEKEAKRAAAAPDKAKLMTYANSILTLPIPELSNALTRGQLISRRQEFISWIESRVDGELL